MSGNRGFKRTRTRSQRGYGSIGNTAADVAAFNTALIENMHEPLMNQIRQHTAAETQSPFPSKFKQISRIRRRPILRTKSESDFPVQISEEDVEEIREKLIRDHRPSFHLKSVPSFTRQQKIVLVSLTLVEFTSFCSMSILAPFFPQRAEEKGVSTTTAGFIFSVYALFVFIASPIMGVLVSKVGPKFLLQVGVLVCAVSNILFGLLDMIEDYLIFTVYCFVVRIFEAIGAAAFSTAGYSYVAQLFPHKIGTVLGILETFVGLGLSVGPAIGGFMYDWGGYGFPFYVLGGLMILTLPINFFLLPGSEFNEEDESESMLKLFRIQPIIIIAIIVVIVSNAWGFMDPTLSTHLAEFHLSAKQIGLFFLLCSALYGLSCPMWGYIADQITQTWILMVIGLFFSAVGLLILGPSPILPIVNSISSNIVALIILGLSISMALLPTFESMLDFAIDGGYADGVRLHGLIAGLWSSMYSLGEVIGPTLGAALMDNYGFPVCASVMAALCFIVGVIVLIYFVGFYELPPLSSLRGERARERDKYIAETTDSGISENENGASSSTSTTSLDQYEQRVTTPINPREITVVHINEKTPLLSSRRRRYSFDLHRPDYSSETALANLSANNLRKKSTALSQYSTLNPSVTFNLPDQPGTSRGKSELEYSVSYTEILKTISITGFGAVEV